MTTYKITKNPNDKMPSWISDKYFTNLNLAIGKKEILKKKKKDGHLYHLYAQYPNTKGWFKLE